MRYRTLLIALILILILNFLLTLLPNILYGFNTFFGGDIFEYYGRINSIYYRNTAIDESYVYKGVIVTYPPGFYVLVAGMKFLTALNNFQLNLCLKIIYIFLFVLLVFIITESIDKKYAIFTLFTTFIFNLNIFTDLYTGYTAISSAGYLFFGTSSISTILDFISIYSILYIFSREKSSREDIPYYILLFLAFTLHGVSHVGEFARILSLFAFILTFFFIHYFFGGGRQFFAKTINIVGVIFLSLGAQVLIHWGRVIDYMTAEGVLYSEVESFTGTSIFTPFIENYWLLVLALFMVSFILLLLSKVLNDKRILQPFRGFKSDFFDARFKYFIYAIYLLIYAYSVFFVTFEGLIGIIREKFFTFPFTLYFGHPYSLACILTKSYGLILFILSFLGVVFFFRQTNVRFKLIAYMYLIAYFLSFGFLTRYTDVLEIYGGLFLLYLFAVSGGLLYLWDFFENRALHLGKHELKSFYSMLICGIIILSLFSVNVVTLINKEPSVIEHKQPENIPFKFGVTNPFAISNDLIDFINAHVQPNSHVLATPDTQRILASVTLIEPICVGWGSAAHFTSNVSIHKFYEVYDAMVIDSDDFDNYVRKYNVTYIIILPKDPYDRGLVRPVGLSGVELQKYFDSKLSRVYTTSYGETVYSVNSMP